MSIYFVRHGQTDWNLNNKMQGSVDIPLNDTGRQQAQTTRALLRDVQIHRIYCSPLSRARETASIINENWNLRVHVDERLKERNFGVYEGQSGLHLNFHELWKRNSMPPFHGAEDSVSFYQRVEQFLDGIIDFAQEENILIVAHGGVSIPFHCYFHGYLIENLNEVMLANCEIAHMERKKFVCVERG